MRALDEEWVEIGGISLCFQYKDVVRISLRIDKQGRAVVSLPKNKKKEALEFVQSKLDWLKKHLERYSQAENIPSPDNGFDGSYIWVWGKDYKTKFVKSSTNEQVFMQDNLLLFTYRGTLTERKKARLVENFYLECIKKMIDGALQKWQPILNLYCSSYKLQRLKSKWGRCNIRTKELLFNTALVHRPVVCLEYVVLHELAHLYEASHNYRFKNFLSHYMEDWQQRRKLLNEFVFKVDNT